jgi:hypothetical protein
MKAEEKIDIHREANRKLEEKLIITMIRLENQYHREEAEEKSIITMRRLENQYRHEEAK